MVVILTYSFSVVLVSRLFKCPFILHSSLALIDKMALHGEFVDLQLASDHLMVGLPPLIVVMFF